MRFLSALILLALAMPSFAQEKPFAAAPPGKGYKRLTGDKRAALYAHARHQHGDRLAMHAKFQSLPQAFDCREKGWVIPVGNQAQCGSCYLYSTIYGTLSQAFVKAGYGKNDGSFVMAVQFGMDCKDFGGCNGGNGTEVIDWVTKNGWPAEKWVDLDGKAHNDYPAYEARSRQCRTPAGAKMWKPAAWGFATGDQSDRPATPAEIKTAMFNYGALNVSIDAGGQFGDGKDTITSLGDSIDHEIEMVAWDDNKEGGAFLLKNQWDTSWGNGGYRWVTYKAAAHIVDIFWVSVTPLPPPPGPTPPVPPVPPTPGTTIIGLSLKYSDGTQADLKVVPKDAEIVHGGMSINELADVLDRLRKAREGNAPCCLPQAKDATVERLERLEAAIEKLSKALGEK